MTPEEQRERAADKAEIARLRAESASRRGMMLSLAEQLGAERAKVEALRERIENRHRQEAQPDDIYRHVGVESNS